jgi:glycosyltransferase involved in cell wall biosynthesis
VRVVFTPFTTGNPYQALLAESLQRQGIDVIYSRIFPNIFWLWGNRKHSQIIHVHWPTNLYRMGKLTIVRSFLFLLRMVFARLLGYRLVWTVHNILPHESTTPALDVFFRRFLIRYCHGVIGHCEYALREVEQRFGHLVKSVVIPHGHYIDSYPDPPDRDFARQQLGVQKDSFVFLVFGQIREYKGIDHLLDQLILLDKELTLIVAGRGSIGNCVHDKARSSKVDLRIFCEFIPDENVPVFFAAADVMGAPYRDVLTSGAVILGLSMGKPVVAPAIGCLPELINDGSGILYDPAEVNGLLAALVSICRADLSGKAAAAKKNAEQLNWTAIAKSTAVFYKEIT